MLGAALIPGLSAASLYFPVGCGRHDEAGIKKPLGIRIVLGRQDWQIQQGTKARGSMMS
jgi:hypothetical protein